MSERAIQEFLLLKSLDSVVVPATTEPFVVQDQFLNGSGIRFAALWSEFKDRYFRKTEAAAPERTLRRYQLRRIAPDAPIIAELGGAARVETTVSSLFALLQRQPDGRPGPLQTNGYANIFYVKDKNGALGAIRVSWDSEGGGWSLDALNVEDPLAWNGQHLIFSPANT